MSALGHMRAARLGEARVMQTGELPLLDPQPGEARVRVEACGICGSDLHFLHGGLMAVGHTPGHEMAGHIDALGPGVNHLSVGDPVAVEPLVSCGKCAECLAGRDSICRSMMLRGVHLPGGMAEQVVIEADRAIPLAQGLSPSVAALTEPMAVAIHGLDRGGLVRGERVLVLGAGAVGLVSLVAAQSMGACEVWVTARHPHQAELAKKLGATRVLREDEADPASLDALSRKVDFDLVVETVGGPANTLVAAASAARPGARIAVLGLFAGHPGRRDRRPRARAPRPADHPRGGPRRRRPGLPDCIQQGGGRRQSERAPIAVKHGAPSVLEGRRASPQPARQ